MNRPDGADRGADGASALLLVLLVAAAVLPGRVLPGLSTWPGAVGLVLQIMTGVVTARLVLMVLLLRGEGLAGGTELWARLRMRFAPLVDPFWRLPTTLRIVRGASGRAIVSGARSVPLPVDADLPSFCSVAGSAVLEPGCRIVVRGLRGAGPLPVRIDEGARIGSFAVIEGGCVVGRGARVGPRAVLGRGAWVAPGAVVPPFTRCGAGVVWTAGAVGERVDQDGSWGDASPREGKSQAASTEA